MIPWSLVNRNRNALALLGIVALLLLAGCGGTSQASPGQTPGITTAVATLTAQPNGTTNLTWDPATKTLTAKIALVGLAPNSTHPTAIMEGSCAHEGAVAHQLTPIKADKYGNVTTTETVKGVAGGIPGTGWNLNIQNGPAAASAAQTASIVCADISNPNAAPAVKQTVQVKVNGAPSATGPAPSGIATLKLQNGTLTVHLTMRGLAPNSKHAAHIHSGTCSRQGPVVHALTEVTADASGNATETTTIKNISSIPSSGWYVNVHSGTDVTNQTGYAPLACGNVSAK
jgi:phenylpyruvate tautomerase PptA (4-oxalocrotonate tautomerase family)